MREMLENLSPLEIAQEGKKEGSKVEGKREARHKRFSALMSIRLCIFPHCDHHSSCPAMGGSHVLLNLCKTEP